MAIVTTTQRENLAVAYGAAAKYASAHSASPGTTGASELSAAPYARKLVTWAAGTVDGVVTATVVFDIPSGGTVAGVGLWDAATGGNFLDGGAVTSQAYSATGTYTITLTYTQS